MKIKYTKDEFNQLDKVCDYAKARLMGAGLKVGSLSCQRCLHNNGFDLKAMWIDCSYTKGNKT